MLQSYCCLSFECLSNNFLIIQPGAFLSESDPNVFLQLKQINSKFKHVIGRKAFQLQIDSFIVAF